MNILDQIAEYAKERVRKDLEKISREEMKVLAKSAPKADGNAFKVTLKKDAMSFICEVKKASPSKGIISEEFPYVEIAKSYEEAGADCISCLTEPKWFLGSDEIFCEIRKAVKTPMIRKKFNIDPYQIYQAKVMGANAVLLICSLLDTATIEEYLGICEDLGMVALVETHDEEEIKSAVSAGAQIIGVNNRNLKDFSVDFDNAAKLRDMIPANCIYVAESGVKGPEDAKTLRKIGADAALIGEAFMRAKDKATMLRDMKATASKA